MSSTLPAHGWKNDGHAAASPQSKRDRIFHYVGFARAADFLALGWIIAKPNCSTMYTDLYGYTMEWLCDCKIPNMRTNA